MDVFKMLFMLVRNRLNYMNRVRFMFQ